MTNNSSGWQTDPTPYRHLCDHPDSGHEREGTYPEGSIWICPVCSDHWQWVGYEVYPEYDGEYPTWSNLSANERWQERQKKLREYKKQFPWWKRPFIKEIPSDSSSAG